MFNSCHTRCRRALVEVLNELFKSLVTALGFAGDRSIGGILNESCYPNAVGLFDSKVTEIDTLDLAVNFIGDLRSMSVC